MAMTTKDLSRSTEPPIEFWRSRPRDVQLSATGVFVTVLAVALLIGSVVLTVALSRKAATEARDRQLFQTTGVTTSAHVLRLWRESNDNKTPRVEYTYEANGRDFIGRSMLPLRRWQSLRPSDALDVRYLSSTPEQSVVVHAEPETLPRWLPVLLGLLTAASGVLPLGAIQMQRRLLAEGRIARATVTKITKAHTSHGGSYRKVVFTYPTLSGSTIVAKASTSRKAPDVGTAIWVVYDPDNPKRSAMYPLQLVKVSRP